MEKMGIIMISSSLWASPLDMVSKKKMVAGAHVATT